MLNLVKWLLRTFLCIGLLCGGATMVGPSMSTAAHEYMKKSFSQFFDVLPMERVGYIKNDAQFLLVSGNTAILTGMFMFNGPGVVRAIFSYLAIAIVSSVLYSMHILHYPQVDFNVMGVCLGCLVVERLCTEIVTHKPRVKAKKA